MRKVTLLLLVAFVFVAGSVLAQHSGFGHGHGGMKGPKMHNGMHQGNPFGHPSLTDVSLARAELNLSDVQVEKLEDLHHDFLVAQIDRRAEVSKAKVELNRLKRDESASMQSIMNAIDKLKKAEAEVEKARYRYASDMKSVLSEEQLKKWQEFKKSKRKDLRPHLRHRWPGGLSDFDEDDDWDEDDEEYNEEDL